MSTRQQQDRLLSLTTPLGGDVLAATGFESHEALSQCFEIRITAESDNETVDFSGALGRNCALTVQSFSDERIFNGVLTEAQWSGGAAEDRTYTLVLRPWFWLLTRNRDYKIFSGQTVPEIIQAVFKAGGFSDYSTSLSETYPVLEYCVQYGESDFAFVSRLMERFGIHYFFKHDADAHTLVLTDSASGHLAVGADIPYRPGLDGAMATKDYLDGFTAERRLCTGKVTLADYDFLAPDKSLAADKASTESYSHAQIEEREFPGKYPRTSAAAQKQQDDGTHFATVRLAAHQALDQRRYAAGDALPLLPGSTFSLVDHADAGSYLVVEARHAVEKQAYMSGRGSGSRFPCKSTFVLQPADRVFQAPAVTPRPLIHGPQTARVVGASGEEIDVDAHGRVLLRFFWDRDGKQSRRVRVAQLWSGAQWGGQFLPRVDQEVVVEFLDGDPDRPLVVGTVYNGKMKPPYELPAKSTMAGLKSNSSKGGGGYNEFVFDDAKGSELVRLHAQRDLESAVLNTETRTVGASFATPKGSPSRTTTLKNGDEVLTIAQGDRKTTLDKGDDATTLSLGDQTVSLTAGSQSVTAGQKITLTANLKIELVVGSSSITLDPAGVTIKAPLIKLQADAMLQGQAPIVKVDADAMLKLQGAITMIN